MGRVKGRRKNESRRAPDPGLAPDAPCWCGSGMIYAQCHQLYDRIYSVPRSKAEGSVCPT